MFTDPQDKVYEGMIIGEHSRDNDLGEPLKGKLTNVRASGLMGRAPDTADPVEPEDGHAYIDNDELVGDAERPVAQALSRSP